MNATQKGLLVTAIQIVLVLSLGGKLLYDRQTRPRVWVRAEVYDPELPIRGRYLAEQLHFKTTGFTNAPTDRKSDSSSSSSRWAYLNISGGELVAQQKGSGSAEWINLREQSDGTIEAVSAEPVLFFVSDKANAPKLKLGQELWVEVTVPKKGPPRPIQLGIKENRTITPIHLE
jgi:hypothetical protein